MSIPDKKRTCGLVRTHPYSTRRRGRGRGGIFQEGKRGLGEREGVKRRMVGRFALSRHLHRRGKGGKINRRGGSF